jgi:site-specific recombinase XerD
MLDGLFLPIIDTAWMHRAAADAGRGLVQWRLCRARHNRHAMAVHRLVAWYREGADVQRLLPQLATYLGHVDVAATQRYLTMTPELLRQASCRFESYAKPEACHE